MPNLEQWGHIGKLLEPIPSSAPHVSVNLLEILTFSLTGAKVFHRLLILFKVGRRPGHYESSRTSKHWGVPMESELQYYSRRAAEELQAAARASSHEAQIRHRTLAERYAVIVEQAASKVST